MDWQGTATFLNYFGTDDEHEFNIKVLSEIIKELTGDEVLLKVYTSVDGRIEFEPSLIGDASHILWDLTHWQIVHQYLLLISADSHDAAGFEYDTRYYDLSTYVSMVFTSYLARKYETEMMELSNALKSELLIKMMYGIWQAHYENDLKIGRGQHICETFLLAKVFALTHEVGHFYFEKKPSIISLYQNQVKEMLARNHEFLCSLDIPETRFFMSSDLKRLVNDLLSGEQASHTLFEELCADYFAVAATSKWWFGKKTQNTESLHLLMESLTAYHIFNYHFVSIGNHWDSFLSHYLRKSEESDFIDFNSYVDFDGEPTKVIDFEHMTSFPFGRGRGLHVGNEIMDNMKTVALQSFFRHQVFAVLVNQAIIGMPFIRDTLAADYIRDFKKKDTSLSDGFSINHDLLEELNVMLSSSLVNDRYTASRVLNAIEQNKNPVRCSKHEKERLDNALVANRPKILGSSC